MIKFTSILCPTDLSDASMRSLTYAAALADWYDAQLTILHVVPTFDPMEVRPGTIGGAPQTVYPPSRDEVMGFKRLVIETRSRLGSDATPQAIADDLRARGIAADPAEVARCCSEPY